MSSCSDTCSFSRFIDIILTSIESPAQKNLSIDQVFDSNAKDLSRYSAIIQKDRKTILIGH